MRLNASCLAVAVALMSAHVALAGGPPFKFVLHHEDSSITFGFLAQPQFESLDQAVGTGKANSLYLRRLRFIAGGKINPKLSFFVESDSANLGKIGPDGRRTADFYLQDAFLTYKFRPEIQIDAGMLLVAASHNSGQSAATLLPIDYGAYSFLASDPTHSKYGRDYGVQARGYISNHLEYRLGAYRGNQDVDSQFPFRYSGRLVWYPLETDTGFFYTGTTLGKKKIIAIGTSFDRQGDYSSNAIDLFIDHPIRSRDALTFQADYMRYDGRTTFLTLPKQDTWLLEASYYFGQVRLGPFMQFASRDFANPRTADDSRLQGGILYWIMGHRLNIKAGIGRLHKDPASDRLQFVLQTQFFYY